MAEPLIGAALVPDAGAAAVEDEFFRSAEFFGAEGVTHTLVVCDDGPDPATVALPLIVREIPDSGGLMDATSPYSYPGARVSGRTLDPSEIDFSGSGLVSIFVRDRLGEPRAFAGGTERSLVQVSDPELPRKSRMSDRQQIRKNEAAGYAIGSTPGPETGPAARQGFQTVYTETMRAVDAGDRYFFGLDYF